MIWPLDPVIAGEQRATAVWVENRGPNPLSIQTRIFRWSQADGDDVISPQKDLVASPPISLIPPGARQMIRLISTQATPPSTEAPYRVLIDELPAVVGAREPTTSGIQLQMRYSIPLFVYAPGTPAQDTTLKDSTKNGAPPSPRAAGVAPQLTWRTEQKADRQELVVHNLGTGYARLTNVRWTDGAEPSRTLSEGLYGYVLPGSERRWVLAAPVPASARLDAIVNGNHASVPRAVP